MSGTLRRLAATLAATFVLAGLPVGGAEAAAPPAGSATRYTMTAFTNTSESNMYVYDSPDGTGYRLVKSSAYTPPSGLIRDPSIIRHTDGKYYITYTTNWSGDTIGFASSTDRVNWTFLGNHTIPLAGLQRTWAPEWHVDTDGSVNVIVSLSTSASGADFQPYRLTATNSALTSWSSPTALAGITGNHIDTFVVKIGSTYHAITKNETTKYLEHATSSSLGGPYTITGTGNWSGWGNWVEGPALVQLDNGGWRIYYDGYSAHKYYYSDSYDGLATWSTPTELPGLTGFARHFTVLKETVAGGATLPVNTTRSLQSVNYPGRYVSSRSGLGYLDPVTTASSATVKQDATVTVVPGLADANCYSLRAADGRYLRHWDFKLRLDSNDGSTAFRGDATYCARPGSAAGSVSLESYNYPGRYLRHYNYELRADVYQDSDTFRADSSFQVVSPWA
ncbi:MULTISPECIES: glycoside hydrolase family 43 protein [unclassified Kitasatospora]|uniref:glycoside hydrolase family 43 protein n=1 Tax=unclassified Kitasatospora TaxID=2633591 RepID=UPI00070C2306|nr:MULTISPECIES: glycoside hydrolase family 43 protein [unclassified Kitasatospora]KQV13917.1 arabinofuranosidase [Kitasatospora sp. Root107]KRB68960.1 arabinofuranosidase [Kitasatospora sp. Root187]